MQTLIAEDLLLLLLDDETGAQRASTSTDTVLGGALLVQLAAEDLVQLQPSESRWRSDDDVVPAPGAAARDPLLQQSLSRVAERPRAAKALLDPIGKGVRDELTRRLADRGILERQDDKVMGMFPRTRWPALDSRHEQEVRHHIGAALVHDQRPGQRTAALIALLLGADELDVIDREGRSRKDIKRRAQEIADGDWASEAVGKAVREVTDAAMLAVVVAATSTTITASN